MISTFTENIQETPVEQARRKLCHRNSLKLINSCVRGGRTLSSKISDFCDFSTNCKKIGEIAKIAKIN